jgi:hypothetical protein
VRNNGSLNRYDSVRGNSIHDNGGAAILLENSANEGITPPTIAGTSPLHGTACSGCLVDIYSDATDEAGDYEGTAAADGSGNWSFTPPVNGPNVTAAATNSDGSTSALSVPRSLVARHPDGRINKGTGSLVGDNVYNLTGNKQTRTSSAAKGATIRFGISIQNDSKFLDSFRLVATGPATSSYTVTFFRGTTDITSAVVGGTYQTPWIASTKTSLITANVTVGDSALAGSSLTRLITISSVSNLAKKDAVKFVVKRS